MNLHLLLVSASLFFAPDTAVDEAKKELDRIQGTWVATTFEVEGRQSAPEFTKSVKLIFIGDKYTQKTGGDEVERGTQKLDPGKKPKHMDISIISGDDAGKLQLAIYDLDGDTLKICAARPGDKERPKEFSTKIGSAGRIYVVLKREKKESEKKENEKKDK